MYWSNQDNVHDAPYTRIVNIEREEEEKEVILQQKIFIGFFVWGPFLTQCCMGISVALPNLVPVALPPPTCGWGLAHARQPPTLQGQNVKNLNLLFLYIKNTNKMTSRLYKAEKKLIIKILNI